MSAVQPTEARAICTCTNRTCGNFKVEFETVAPSVFRLATGRFLACPKCHDIVLFLRKAGP